MAHASLQDPDREQHLVIRRVAVVLNAGAGSLSVPFFRSVEAQVAGAFDQHDVHAEIELVTGHGLKAAVTGARERAECGEVDAVIAGGGDGTIRAVASALAETKVPLGVLPLGTLNHFAKDIGIPLDIEDATAVIAGGNVRVIDLAAVNGETFINNSSIGVYPYLVIDRERRRAHGLAKWLAMVAAFFRMLRHFPRRRLRISAQGFERPYRTPCLFVGNNEYSTDFFSLGRRRRLNTGKLWFYVVKPRDPLAFFWMVCRMCFGHRDEARDLDTFELAEAQIAAKASRLPVALDGEVRLLHTPLHYRSLPSALRVIAPVARRADDI